MLEPSCCSVFRDELVALLPEDEDARRLQHQTFLFSEFLQRRAPHFGERALEGRHALVHLHCHHRALLNPHEELELLKKTGLQFDIPEEGCCGLAGSFGYRRGQPYDVSIGCAERTLLPAVRAAGDDTLIVANGYSCREQIGQLSGRRAQHLAEVLAKANSGKHTS
jgi:Fe-S oxidoreductase